MEKTQDKKSGNFFWKLTEEEIKNQVYNYEKLKITKSYRKLSALIFLSWVLISILISTVIFSWSYLNLPAVILYVFISIFVYNGRKWSIILLMLLFTFEMLFKIADGYIINETIKFSPFIWWFIIMPLFYKALLVENARSKIKEVSKKQIEK